MSTLYYGMQSNLRESDDDHATPYPDYIAFDNPVEKLHISVSCDGWSDWGVDKKGILSGRYKGCEVAITDYDDNEIHNYEEMTDEDFELLKSSFPYEIGMYFPDTSGYDDGFATKLNDIDISLMHGEIEKKWHCEEIDVFDYGD